MNPLNFRCHRYPAAIICQHIVFAIAPIQLAIRKVATALHRSPYQYWLGWRWLPTNYHYFRGYHPITLDVNVKNRPQMLVRLNVFSLSKAKSVTIVFCFNVNYVPIVGGGLIDKCFEFALKNGNKDIKSPNSFVADFQRLRELVSQQRAKATASSERPTIYDASSQNQNSFSSIRRQA